MGEWSWRLLLFPVGPLAVVLTLLLGPAWLCVTLTCIVPLVVSLAKSSRAARAERRWIQGLPFEVNYEAYLGAGHYGDMKLEIRWRDAPAEDGMLEGLLATIHLKVHLEHHEGGMTIIRVPGDEIWTIGDSDARATNYPAYRVFKKATEGVLLKLNEVNPIESITFTM